MKIKNDFGIRWISYAYLLVQYTLSFFDISIQIKNNIDFFEFKSSN